MNRCNLLSYIFIFLFLLPLIIGFIRPFTRERLQISIGSLFDNVEFILGAFLSIYLTKCIFFKNSSGFFKEVYGWIPQTIKSFFYGKDILTYLIVVPFLLFLILLVLRIITGPVYNLIVPSLSNVIYSKASKGGKIIKRTIGVLWELPKAVYLPIIFALMVNFYTYYFYSPVLSQWMNESSLYQFISDNTLSPVLNSNIAKKIPVIVNDSFRRFEGTVSENRQNAVREIGNRVASQLNINVIKYFNGVTLDEAVKSTDEIDNKSIQIVSGAEGDREKAYKIYRWVSSNIKYDFEKAEKISKEPGSTMSGAQIAFNTSKGVCFDYSSLYVAMCRNVGLKVRMVTGLAYSGLNWGDHAWNQVYISEEERWIDVDTTFGSVGNYFDKNDFEVDHMHAEVQGEW